MNRSILVAQLGLALLAAASRAGDTGTSVRITGDGVEARAWTRLPSGKADAANSSGPVKFGRADVVGSDGRRFAISSAFALVLSDGTRISDRFDYRSRRPGTRPRH
jgi:hypothetical protein